MWSCLVFFRWPLPSPAHPHNNGGCCCCHTRPGTPTTPGKTTASTHDLRNRIRDQTKQQSQVFKYRRWKHSVFFFTQVVPLGINPLTLTVFTPHTAHWVIQDHKHSHRGSWTAVTVWTVEWSHKNMIFMIRAQKSHRTDKCNPSPSGFVLRKEVGDRYIQIDCQRWAWVWVMLKRFQSLLTAQRRIYMWFRHSLLTTSETQKKKTLLTVMDYISKATVMPL